MTKTQDKTNKLDIEKSRRIPCMMVYLDPFRMIESEELEEWKLDIEDCRRKNWDYVKLHEIAGYLDIGLYDSERPYPMVVCRDGALGLPPIAELTSEQNAISYFNKFLAAFLLGGIYCQAVSLDNLEFGSIIDYKYLRSHTVSNVNPNEFHFLSRMKMTPPLFAQRLINPKTISYSELQKAINIGLEVFQKIPNLNGGFLLKATTGIARRDWAGGLANLWIVVEQIVEYLWEREVITPSKEEKSVTGRLKQLKDNRTWTLATRLELLHQKEIVSSETLDYLSIGRRARNNLSHEGKEPDECEVTSCYSGVIDLLKIALPNVKLPFYELDLGNHSLSDPFQQKEPVKIEPVHGYVWEIPELPGEHEINIEEARIRERNHNTD